MPLGSVLNPVEPAAVGMRTLACVVVQAAVFGAFSKALPDYMPACPASSVCLVNVKTTRQSGETIMASIGPVGGGGGGAPDADGSDASGANMAFLRNTPVEINEAEVPITIRKYGLVKDSGGAGRYRGGMGLMMEFQVFSPNTLVTARNRDRTLFSSWGVKSGDAGRTAHFVRNPGLKDEEDLGNTDLVMCKPGDIIRLEGNGGGGYGLPYEREAERVEEDVRCGRVSVAAARASYGVVIESGRVVQDQTLALRKQMAAAGRTVADSLGASRAQHETLWTPERYDALTACLENVPVRWRYFLKHQMFDRMAALSNIEAGPAIVHTLFESLADEYQALSKAA